MRDRRCPRTIDSRGIEAVMQRDVHVPYTAEQNEDGVKRTLNSQA
jgi:hypothetical protein